MAAGANRSDLAARLRGAIRRPSSARSAYERAFFGDDAEESLSALGVATESEQAAARDRGEVFGAQTGRAARAIDPADLEDIRWDPSRAYPQIQTGSTNPERPRTVAAGYDPENSILRITFRNGVTYEYLGVSPRVWSTFQRAPSPGQYINAVLDQYPYRPAIEGD